MDRKLSTYETLVDNLTKDDGKTRRYARAKDLPPLNEYLPEFARITGFRVGDSTLALPITPIVQESRFSAVKEAAKIAEDCPTWREFLTSDEVQQELEHIDLLLEKEWKADHEIFPQAHNVFRIFRMVPLDRIRVVIIGQDPYITTIKKEKRRAVTVDDKAYCVVSKGQYHYREDGGDHRTPILAACGLAFSAPLDEMRPSLRNIYAEIRRSIDDRINPSTSNPDLIHWVAQGVFLINAALTCWATLENGQFKGISASHTFWRGFMIRLMKYIDLHPEIEPIFVFWGNEAKIYANHLTSRNLKLEAPHPVARSTKFIGCDHFATINDILRARGDRPINWLPMKGGRLDVNYVCAPEDLPRTLDLQV